MAGCPDPHELEAFLLGHCADDRQEWLEAHVSQCATCARAMHDLRATDPLVAAVRRAAAEPMPASPALEQLMAAAKGRGCGPSGNTPDLGPGVTLPAEPEAPPPLISGNAGGTDPVTPLLAPAQAAGELGRLGPYRVLEMVGQGGMGIVFRAEDPELGRPVALKVLRPEVAASAAAQERFLREARAAAQLRHDHIITIYHVGKDRGVPFLAMEFLEGTSLAALLRAQKALPPGQVLRLGIQVAEGLAAAHARGLVHRDIKPENIWVEGPAGGGRVKLLDFGLARLAAGAGQQLLTHQGTVLGTPAFMSPEQARGEAADHRSDLFSLGSVLYRALTGSLPFEGPDVVATLMAVSMQDPKPPRQCDERIAGPLSDLVLRLLEKDPAARPQSAREVAEALRRIERELPPTADVTTREVRPFRNAGRGTRRFRPYAWLAAGALLAVFLPLAYLFGGAVVRFAGNKGELVVEVDDPNVEVVVKQNDVIVRDRTDKREFILGAGDGVVEVYEKDGVGPLKTEKFSLNRGGRTTVTVTLAPPAAGTAADPDRAAAEWVVSNSGDVEVGDDSPSDPINSREALPKTPFLLYGIGLADAAGKPPVDDVALENLRRVKRLRNLTVRNPHVTDAGLKRLTAFPGLRHLGFLMLDNTQVTDAGLAELEHFPELHTVNLMNSATITDAAIPHLRDLPALTYLHFSRTRVTDGGLAELRGMTLSYFGVVEDPAVTDAGMEHLRGLTGLTRLALDGTRVGDAGLVRLQTLTKLESLTLGDTRVTDAGLEHLARLPELRDLSLHGLPITGAGLDRLKKLRRLQQLYLSDTKLADGDLAHLRGLTNLTELDLDGTPVADAGLEHLAGLTSLRRLTLKRTKVTPAGVKKLQTALPNCKIE